MVVMKKFEDLDMTAIVDAAVTAIHDAQGSPGGPLDPVQKNLHATALMPVIWHTTKAVMDQLAKDEENEAVPEFIIPDTLEGLEGFGGLSHA